MQNLPVARHNAFRRAAAAVRRVVGAGTTAFLLLLSASCGDDGAFVLEGRFRGVSDAQFYIYSQDDFRGIDTLRIASDGTFRYTRAIDEPTVLTVLYPNFSTTLIVAAPGDRLRIEADASHLAEIKVSGSDENERLSALRHDLSALGAAEAERAVAAFVRQNPARTASTALVRQYFLETTAVQPDTLAALLAAMRRGGASGRAFAALEADVSALFPLQSGQEGGRRAAEKTLRLTAADGRTLTFPDAARPTLVYFWATWHHESVLALHRFAALSRRRSADAAFIAVAIDEDSARVRPFLERDTLLSCGIADGRALDGPLVRRVGFSRLPQARLVGTDGRLVAVSDDPEALESRLR